MLYQWNFDYFLDNVPSVVHLTPVLSLDVLYMLHYGAEHVHILQPALVPEGDL